MATYVNDLRLTELATGEGSGTWGTTTNVNLELIGEALGYGTQDCFASDADATTTVADGVSDPARAMYFKVTSSATLTATRTLTIAPNTVSRVMLIENATTGSQSIAISQGSGGNVTIASGQVKMVYLDGAGSGAAVVDAMASLELGTITVANLTATTADINGGTVDGADITVGAGKTLDVSAGTFTVANDQISGDAINGGTATPTTLTSTTVNATTVDTTNIELTNLKAKDGTAAGSIADSTGVVTLASSVLTTTDINGGTIDGVTIGGSSAGAITGTTITGTSFVSSGDMTFGDNDKAIFGAGSDLEIYHDGSGSFIADNGTGDLHIRASNTLRLQNSAGQLYAYGFNGGEFALYHNNAQKLATTATGIDVTGTIVGDGLTVDGTVTGNIASFINDGNSTNAKGIKIQGGTDNGFGENYKIEFFDGDGTASGRISTNTGSINIEGGPVTINEGGSDYDFRVESNGNTHALFVDAANNRVGIGTTTRGDFSSSVGGSAQLQVEGTAAANSSLSVVRNANSAFAGYLTLGKSRGTAIGGTTIVQDGDQLGTINFQGADGGGLEVAAQIRADVDGTPGTNDMPGRLIFFTTQSGNVSSTEALRIDSSQNATFQKGAVFNESGVDADFRVESDAHEYALFVNAGLDAVGINQSTPNAKLHITTGTNSGTGQQIDVGLDDGSFSNPIAVKINQIGGTTSDGVYPWDVSIGGAQRAFQFVSRNGSGTGAKVVHAVVDTGSTMRSRMEFTNTESVFNEPGVDQNFRVESVNNANMLFVDAGNDTVKIGTTENAVTAGSGNARLVVANGIEVTQALAEDSVNKDMLRLSTAGSWSSPGNSGYYSDITWDNGGTNTMGRIGLRFGGTVTGGESEITIRDMYQGGFGISGNIVSFGSNRFSIFDGSMTVNEDSLDQDFRVESDTNTHMLFVDASANKVGIGTSLAGTTLTVSGDNSSTHALVGYFTHETAANTVDILSVTNQTTNSGTAIYGRLVATSATSNNSAVIEFWASLSRSGGGANTATAVTPVVAKAIAGTSISAGTLAWSGTTLQYTTSSAVNYVGYSMELQITNRDGATITILP